jgi:hypothetical protein
MTATELRTHTSHDLDASLRLLPAVADAINQLTKPRIIHTEIRDDGHGGITGIHTEQHPPLIDLLEHGTGSTNRGRSSGIRIPIDAEAHELLKEIRQQVRPWLTGYGIRMGSDLKWALSRDWYPQHDNAVRRGHVPEPEHRAILRKLDQWADRIDAKYDPDQHREWMDACPALIRNEAGDVHRCDARKHLDDGELKSAIDLNVTRLIARCRTCGTRWEGERGLMQLRYETNLRDLEQDAT